MITENRMTYHIRYLHLSIPWGVFLLDCSFQFIKQIQRKIFSIYEIRYRSSPITYHLHRVFNNTSGRRHKTSWWGIRMNSCAKSAIMISQKHNVYFQTFEKILRDTLQLSYIDIILLLNLSYFQENCMA